MPSSADTILREAFVSAGIEGASTHCFRRTALTQMSNAGIALRVIQEISGHSNLEQLHRYLEVRREKVRGAIASLSMLSYTGKLYYPTYPIISFLDFLPKGNNFVVRTLGSADDLAKKRQNSLLTTKRSIETCINKPHSIYHDLRNWPSQ